MRNKGLSYVNVQNFWVESFWISLNTAKYWNKRGHRHRMCLQNKPRNWVKVFKNGPSRICGIQPSKKLKWYGLLKQSAYCLLQFTHRTLFQIKLSKFYQKFEMNLKYRSSTGKKSWFWSPFFKGCKTAVFKAVVEIEENLKYLPGPFQKIMVHF